MPKQKTNRSARKRFKLTKTGKVKRNRAYKSHLKQTKSQKRIRKLRKSQICAPGDARVAKMLIGPSE
ncbi:MAG: 50S ribosomal protein L35 [Planctomycetota bacterium]